MMHKRLLSFLIAAALSACSSDEGTTSACTDEADCEVESPDASSVTSVERDTGVGNAAEKDAGGTTTRADAGRRDEPADAGQVVRDAGPPAVQTDSGAPVQPSGDVKP